MKFELSALITFVIDISYASMLEGRDTCTSDDLALGGMQSYEGVYWGFAPDCCTGGQPTSMSTINGWTGKKASTYGYNSQMTGLPYTGQQFDSIEEDVVQSGAVFVPSIMPTNVRFSDITREVADQIAGVLERFTSQGVEVWLRFAHEMNWYAGQGQVYAGGTPDEFIEAWQLVHAAVASNPKVLMFWCPNIDTVENIQPWWPGPDYVDIVGVDNYPPGYTTFASAYGDFYDGFAARYNKHFCIGETGSFEGGTVEEKEAWVSQLANVDLNEFPCFKSITWFEYYKTGYDYRIIMGQLPATIKETLSYFK